MGKLLWVFLVCAFSVAAQSVEGTVISAIDGEPIAGVRLEIRAGAKTPHIVTTDADGRFRLDGLEDGDYRARNLSRNYFFEELRGFRISAGSPPVKLEMAMIPLGTVRGRVVDNRGEPVHMARVVLEPRGGSMPSKDGRFASPPLSPGTYTISAMGEGAPPSPDRDPETGRKLGWIRTYYPGVADRNLASKIVVPPGGAIDGIEIRLLSAPVTAVRGVVLRVDGTAAEKARLSLQDRLGFGFEAEADDSGRFEFAAVPDGEWWPAVVLPDFGVSMHFQTPIVVSEELGEVRLQLQELFALNGRIVMPEGAPPILPPPAVSVYPAGSAGRGGLVYGRENDDGSFTVRNLHPGVYRIRAAAPPGYYLDEIRLGTNPLLTRDAELNAATPALTVVFKAGGGSVEGSARDCNSGRVYLIPEESGLRRDGFLRVERCDTADRYRIASVRPGAYYVVAVAGRFYDPLELCLSSTTACSIGLAGSA